jgi:tripeptidyl-peptidase I
MQQKSSAILAGPSLTAVLVLTVSLAAAVTFAAQTAPPVVDTTADVYDFSPSWHKVRRAPATHIHRLTVALKQRNVEKLVEFVDAVSYPDSPLYGKYMSVSELTSMLAPSKEAVAAVGEYFEQAGATKVDLVQSMDFMHVYMRIADIETLFGVEMNEFAHKGSGRGLYRTTDRTYKTRAVPQHVQQHIDVITGVSDFFSYDSERKTLKQRQGREARSASATNAPEIEQVHGSEFDFRSRVVLYCQNGQATQNASIPCADFPPAISQVSVVTTPVGYPSQIINVSIDSLSCASAGSSVSCLHPVVNLPRAYARTHIGARVQYEDGSYSALGKYPVVYSPSPYILPDTVYNQYGIPKNLYGTNPKNLQSVVAFEKQYISYGSPDADLNRFFDFIGQQYRDPIVRGENVNAPTSAGGESTLDIQYIMGVGNNIKTVFWSVSGQPKNGGYILEWALQVSNVSDAEMPLVTSISYGDTEEGYVINVGPEYIPRMEVELAKLCARGMTVIAGSGDAGSSNVGEMGNDLSKPDPDCSHCRAFYPSDSPYVTSLSATFLTTNTKKMCYQNLTAGQPIVCDQSMLGEIPTGLAQGLFWTTGGGFSNMFAPPSYQKAAIQNYLNSAPLPSSSYFNSTGAGYADISTLGHNLLVVWNSKITSIGGTSASGPVAAGIVSLLNDARLNAGKSSLGRLNPWLYQMAATIPQSFYDVTYGSNGDGDIQPRSSPFASFCPNAGFQAVAGWDPPSGLGSPRWGPLYESAMQLP